MPPRVDLTEIATSLKFKDEKDMLVELYKARTLQGIGVYLGVAECTIRNRMVELRIPRRVRGISP
jgi:hypothetical protein